MSRVINYAKIRNGQKRPDLSQEEKDPALKNNEFPVQSSLSSSPLNGGEQTPYPGAASEKADVNKYSSGLFGDNLLTDNMDYINSLLKDQFMDAAPPKNTQKRNKRMTREELKLAGGSGLRRPTGELISPVKLDSAISPPVNSPNLEGNSSLLSPSEPDLKDKIEGIGQGDMSGVGESEVKIKGGRNNSDMISTKDVENYENYYQNGVSNVGKRSTSMEDIRISQKNFSKINAPAVGIVGGSILSHLENIPGQEADTPAERSSLQIPLDRSPQSVYNNNDNSNISRAEFASSLNQYIEYFQRSENVQYRSIKASQYFSNPSQRGNTQRSSGQHVFTTGTGATPNNEVESLKNQVKKLKAKVEDLQLMNELLAQERKSVKKREQELLERAENAEAELGNYKKKTKQYRERLRNTEDLLKKEKVDNENNLMALRRVLSNNINNVLEYKINTYMKSGTSKPHHRETNSIFTSPDLHHYDKIKLAKDKEKRKNYSTNPNVFFNGGISRTQASIGNLTETLGNMKTHSKNTNHMNIKEKVSPMLSSNKADQSLSEEEDELKALQKKFGSLMRGEGYYDDHQAEEDFLRLNKKRSSQYSMQQSDGIDSSSELADETDLSLYGVSKYEANKKVQQIKKLQDQLAKLIEQEESSANDISGYTKSISQRNINVNAGKKHKGHTNSLFDNVAQKQNNFLNMISSESKYEPKARNYYK